MTGRTSHCVVEGEQEAVSESRSDTVDRWNLCGSTVLTASSRQKLSRNTRLVTFTVMCTSRRDIIRTFKFKDSEILTT